MSNFVPAASAALPNETFDVIVIGAGQGAALARMLGEDGQRVALIEREAVGGTCVNRGCTPTKAHIAAAKRYHDAGNAGFLGITAEKLRFNLATVAKRSQGIVDDFRAGNLKRLEETPGLELIMGNARFTGARSVEVATFKVRPGDGPIRHLEAKQIVIATGARTRVPALEGLREVNYLDNRSALQLREVPESLIILGGGYVACEFAQMFSRFGSQITVVQSAPQLLDHEDEDVACALRSIFEDEGIRVHTGAHAKTVRITKDPAAPGVELALANGKILSATHLMVSVGRQPNTGDLNLEAAGIKPDGHGYIPCDDYLEAAPGIFVLGDAKPGPAFTHVAYDDARILAARICHGQKRSLRDRVVPYTVFTDPQLGRVGLSEREAHAAGHDFRVAKLEMSETARGLETGEDRGFLKALVEAESGKILGAACLARDGGEVMAVIQVAMMSHMPYSALRDGMFAHPTLAESLNNLFLAMDRDEQAASKSFCVAPAV